MRRTLPLAVLAASLTVPVLGVPAASAAGSSTVTTFAGGGVNDGGPATSAALAATGAAVLGSTTWVADAGHNRIRAITGGTISTVAGSGDLVDGVASFSGDGGPATAAHLNNPTRVRVNAAGDLYVVDRGNHRVRRIDHTDGSISTVYPASPTAGLSPVDVALDPTSSDIAIADSTKPGVVIQGSGATISTPGLQSISAVAYTPAGDLLVADRSAGTVTDFHQDTPGAFTAGTVTDQLPGVSSLAVDSTGLVYAGTSAGVETFTIGGTPTLIPSPCTGVATVDPVGQLLLACKDLYQRAASAPNAYTKVAGDTASLSGVDAPVDGATDVQAALSPTGGLAVVGSTTYVTGTRSLASVTSGVVHPITSSLTTPRAVAPQDGGGVFVLDQGKVRTVTAGGTVASYAATSPGSTITDGQSATTLPLISSIAAGGSAGLYVGVGDTVALIKPNKTVHVLVPSLQAQGGKPAGGTAYETAVAMATLDSSHLLVLSDEGDTADPTVITSRVRSVDTTPDAETPVATTQVYLGPRLSALAVAADGTTYTAENRGGPTGALVEALGSDGSTAIIAGGGHLTGATQAGNQLFLPDVTGLAVAADGSVLIASPGAHRVLAIASGFTATPPGPVTNLVATPGTPSGGLVSTTFSWDAPAGMASDSHFEVATAPGNVTTPLSRSGVTSYPFGTTSFPQNGEVSGTRYAATVYVVSAAGEVSAPTSVSLVAPGDTTPPTAPVLAAGYSTGSILKLSWTPSTSPDLDHTEVRLAQCPSAPTPTPCPPAPTDSPAYSGTLSSITLTVTPNDFYTLTLTSVDAAGNASTNPTPYTFQAGNAPAPVFGAAPAAGSFTGPTVSITPSHLYDLSGTASCTLDGAARPCTTDQPSVLQLASGAHTFAFRLVTSLGSSPLLSRSFKVDATAPTASLRTLAPFTVAGTASLSIVGVDIGAGNGFWRIRYRKADLGGVYGAFVSPPALQHLMTRSASIPLLSGTTTCAQVQGVDKVGNTSAWSPLTCTARPLDDKSLATSGPWTRSTNPAYFGSTVTSTKSSRAALVRTGATFRRLALLATTCRICGSVQVYSGSTLLATINLASTSTHRQVLLVLRVVSTRKATITLRVASPNGKLVEVDGLGISRA